MATSTTTSKIAATEGSGKNVATASFTEDAVTKEGQRIFPQYNSSAPTLSTGNFSDVQADVNGNIKVSLATLIAGEDLTNGVLKTEAQYSYSRKTADGQVKAAAGFVHTVTISPTTASPTAGLITIYDNTAESGTPIFTEWVFATTPAHTVILDMVCATGIYVGYDGSVTNVSVSVSYR